MAVKHNSTSSVLCMDCQWASLMQWFENPVIAECNLMHEKQVAASPRNCKEFKKSLKRAEIKHFDSYD